MTPFRTLAVAALLLLTATPALAGESVVTRLSDDGLDLINEDLEAGRIDAAEAAAQRFYRLLRPADGDARYRLGEVTGDPICGTTLMNTLRGHWDDLTPLQRHHVAETTDPTYKAWLEQGGMPWTEGDVHAAQATQRATCFDPEDLRGFSSYQNQTRSPDEWFEIHWNEEGLVTQQRIDWMAGWFDDAFDVEVYDLGFFAPWGITSNQLLVIVERLGSGVFGFTSLAQCGIGGYMPYIVMNSQYVDDDVSLRPTAAHELFHAIQQVYGFEEFFINDNDRNRWWLEASAVYAATVTNPFDANRHALHAVRWTTDHHKSMVTYDDAGHQYGMVVWPLSLANTLGDPVWHRDFWEQLRDRTGFVLRDEFDDFLRERGSSFDEEYRRFLRDAPFGSQSDFAVGIQDTEEWIGESLLAGEHDEGDYPVEATIDGDARVERPEFLGQNYAWFDSDDVDRDKALLLEVWGDGVKNDRGVEWFVELMAVEDDEVVATHSLELSGEDPDGDDRPQRWVGRIQLNDFRSSYDALMLGVSPVTDFGEGGATWGYSAELIDGEEAAGFSEPAPVDDGDDEDDGDGCGSSMAGRATPWAVALLLPVVRVRRRGRSSAI